jgi:sirohydrochlorin ferrochelatase
VRLRRGAFDDLVERQLALFSSDEAALIAEADEAEAAWIRSGRDHAEEAYGDYQLVVDAIADGLLELRDAYAATLDEDKADTYRRAFAAGVKRRFRRYASLVSDVESA